MKELSAEQKKEIIEKIKEKVPEMKCPMCGNAHFTLIDGFFSHFLQIDLKRTSIGGPSVPTVAVACNKCGFLSQHAAGVLGLLAKIQEEEVAKVKATTSSPAEGDKNG